MVSSGIHLLEEYSKLLPCFADTVRVYDYVSKTPMCQAKYNSGGSSLIWVPKDVSRMGLRMVPTFVTEHTLCASRDTRISDGWCLLIQRYFCAV